MSSSVFEEAAREGDDALVLAAEVIEGGLLLWCLAESPLVPIFVRVFWRTPALAVAIIIFPISR